MFSTRIFCNKPLGHNESIEMFPSASGWRSTRPGAVSGSCVYRILSGMTREGFLDQAPGPNGSARGSERGRVGGADGAERNRRGDRRSGGGAPSGPDPSPRWTPKVKQTLVAGCLEIALRRPGATGERGSVVIRYHGLPAAALRIGPNKHGDRTFSSDNWPDLARHWLIGVDHPYDKAISEFIVTAPAHYQVVSNGLLVEETDLGDGFRRTHGRPPIFQRPGRALLL